jgi:hypothetical protein
MSAGDRDQCIFENIICGLFPTLPEDNAFNARLNGVVKFIPKEASNVLESIGVRWKVAMMM